MTITSKISKKALELLQIYDDGLRFSELRNLIVEDMENVSVGTVGVVLSNLEKRFPDRIYKPSRGLFRLASPTSDLENVHQGKSPAKQIKEVPLDEDRIIIENAPKKVTYQPTTPTVQTLYDDFKEGDLLLSPDFQRKFVWDKKKASSLIESMILNIPLPIIYVAEVRGKHEVIDGQQRLTSIFSFIDGLFPDGTAFKLNKNIKILADEIGGKSFKELDKEYQREIKKCALPVVVIDEASQEDVKFEMFERLNTNITSLGAQELRNCMYRGPYNDFLKKMAEYPDFQYIINKPQHKKRMLDAELVLMFCAFYHTSPDRYSKNLTQMLNEDMRKYQYISHKELEEVERQYRKSVSLIKHIWGKRAFNVYSIKPDTNIGTHSNVLNQGLYQILMYWFIPFKYNQVIPYVDLIREELMNLEIHNPEFIDTLTGSGTNAPRKIRKKFDIWGMTLKGILKYPKDEPRVFSYELKEQLWNQSTICQICSQKISAIDDAEIDHIVCYWVGGKTVPENARLTHRLCNRTRGGASSETETEFSTSETRITEISTAASDKPLTQIEASIPTAYMQWGGLSVKRSHRVFLPSQEGKQHAFTIHFRGYGETIAWMSQHRIKIPSKNLRDIVSRLKITSESRLIINVVEPFTRYELADII